MRVLVRSTDAVVGVIGQVFAELLLQRAGKVPVGIRAVAGADQRDARCGAVTEQIAAGGAFGMRRRQRVGRGQQPRKVRIERQEVQRSEAHTSELQSLMRNSYAVFCLKKKKQTKKQ